MIKNRDCIGNPIAVEALREFPPRVRRSADLMVEMRASAPPLKVVERDRGRPEAQIGKQSIIGIGC